MRFIWFVPIFIHLHKRFYKYEPFVFPEGISIHNPASYESMEGINETELYILADEMINDTLENKTTWEELIRFGGLTP
jgi:hypothetical protein